MIGVVNHNCDLIRFVILSQDELAEKAVKLTAREKRFIKFASVEFDGQIYCKIVKQCLHG
jgi:hypothetical protein